MLLVKMYLIFLLSARNVFPGRYFFSHHLQYLSAPLKIRYPFPLANGQRIQNDSCA